MRRETIVKQKKEIMKKTVFLLIAALCIMSCSKSDDENQKVDISKKIVGEWVYDHPIDGVWETMKFTSSGVFYYSNLVSSWGIDNQNNDGRYFLDGYNITGTYFLEGNVSMNLDMTIKRITNYEFTARFNDTGLSFTYAKLLEKREIKVNESVTPNYENLVKDVDIRGYSSHDTNIATVDATTGKVVGVSGGRTYIDVLTDEGVAVVEINVESDELWPDFSRGLGKTHNQILSMYGSYPYENTNEDIIYVFDNSAADFVIFTFDKTTNLTTAASVRVNDNIKTSAVVNFLDSKFIKFPNGTPADGSQYAWLNASTVSAASVGIVYYPSDKLVTYVNLADN